MLLASSARLESVNKTFKLKWMIRSKPDADQLMSLNDGVDSGVEKCRKAKTIEDTTSDLFGWTVAKSPKRLDTRHPLVTPVRKMVQVVGYPSLPVMVTVYLTVIDFRSESGAVCPCLDMLFGSKCSHIRYLCYLCLHNKRSIWHKYLKFRALASLLTGEGSSWSQ